MGFKVEIVIDYVEENGILGGPATNVLPGQVREIGRVTAAGPRAFVKDVVSAVSMAMDEIEAF